MGAFFGVCQWVGGVCKLAVTNLHLSIPAYAVERDALQIFNIHDKYNYTSIYNYIMHV